MTAATLLLQACSAEYWRQLCPFLHVSDTFPESRPDACDSDCMASVPPETAAAARASLRRRGFFCVGGGRHGAVDGGNFDEPPARHHAALAKGITLLSRAGWAPSFVLVYGESWDCFGRLVPLLQVEGSC